MHNPFVLSLSFNSALQFYEVNLYFTESVAINPPMYGVVNMPILNSDKGSLFDTVEIIGLFGDQNEIISFDGNENLKLLYGLNAAGKTTLLSIINAVLNKNFLQLMRLPFEKVIFHSKRYHRRGKMGVPFNAESYSEEFEKIANLANKVDFDIGITEDAENEKPDAVVEIGQINVPNRHFIDNHKLTISKILPSSMTVENFRSYDNFEFTPSTLIIMKHELERKIFTENEDEEKLFNAIEELNNNADFKVNSGFYKNELFNNFGCKSVVEDVYRALDGLDISKQQWYSLKKDQISEFVIEIQDYSNPKRYEWNTKDIELPDIAIKEYDDHGEWVSCQYFIDYHLPKELYLKICRRRTHRSGKRNYFDSEGNEIACIRSHSYPLGVNTVTPIDYFLQNDYHTANMLPNQDANIARRRLYNKFYFISNVIFLSADRNVGNASNQKSELIDFANNMKSKIEGAVRFLRRQSFSLSQLWKEHGPKEINGKLDLKDFKERLICLCDSKSTDENKDIERIIEDTDTFLELVKSSLQMFEDEIIDLVGIDNYHNMIFLNYLNNTSSDNVIHLHDKDISIEKICVALDDLTSIFRLKRLLQEQFGKNISLDRGRFIFSDVSSDYITINQLSSGEKQLMLLYWKILSGMERDALENIVLIDEPELSLHIGWQRDFVENLLELIVNQTRYGDDSDGGFDNIKIIIATHSPSILTNHFDNSYELGLQDGV